MKFAYILTLVLYAATCADACECRYEMLSNETIKTAGSVSLVEIRSLARFEEKDPSKPAENSTGILRVEILFRGKPPKRAFRYSESPCCGIKLIVGHYYAVFLSEGGQEAFLNPGNTMHVGTPGRVDRRKLGLLKRVLAGEFEVEQAFGQFPSGNLLPVPAPLPKTGEE